MKKTISICMVAGILTAAAAGVMAGCDVGGKQPQYTFELSKDSSFYRITDCVLPNNFSGTIEIPAEHEGKPVRELVRSTPERVFHSEKLSDEGIEYVVPNSIRCVGAYVFSANTTKITFSEYDT
ncbi:MAG: hypothetical protein K2N74_01330, partial [Clostridiales bacterium]|nr:hypothetical protein [Clostridiales bacterium]